MKRSLIIFSLLMMNTAYAANFDMNQNDSSLTQSNRSEVTINPTILRAYDIRGTFEETLSYDVAKQIGQQFGGWLVEQHKHSIAVGYDGRLSSPELCNGLIEGLRDKGINVTNIGLGPTPMLYFATKHLETDAGIMITGSHNPPRDNGFKITLADRPFFGDDIKQLNDDRLTTITYDTRGNLSELCIKEDYLQRLVDGINWGNVPLRVAIDCGNGATGEIVKSLCERLPNHIQVQLLYADIDGNFPNHHPDPAEPHNLEDLISCVKRDNLDLGLAFDGDGDRLGVVDRSGRIIWGDQLTLFFAQSILQSNPGATIMADVKTSQFIFDSIETAGGKAIMSPTGHSYFKILMPKNGAFFGGEVSGHFFFKDRYLGYDDGVYAAIRMLERASNGNDIGQFLDSIPHFHATPEIKIPCPDDKKFEIVNALSAKLKADGVDFCDVDGIRFKTESGGWLVRPSNTTPVLVTRFFDSPTEEGVSVLKAHLQSLLADYIGDVQF